MIHEDYLKEFERKYSNSLFLFIGEGNFSFSASVAASGILPNLNSDLIATDYVPDLKDELESENGENDINNVGQEESKRRKSAYDLTLIKENVKALKSRQYKVFFDVDASKLHEHEGLLSLCASKRGIYSTIYVIFNFPHAKSKKMKIGLNRDLLRDFFISCEKGFHVLNDNQKGSESQLDVVPIVSLCAGQCGIPEVDSVSRSWGNSFQINEMAAQGNFVCTSIRDFNEWDLLKRMTTAFQSCNCNEKGARYQYQSSYYRLQSGVSFTTKDGLTLCYDLRPPVDPSNTSRLESMLKFAREDPDGEVVAAFIKAFPGISEEKMVFCGEYLQGDNKRPYFHQVSFRSADVAQCILNFLNDSEVKVELEDKIAEDGSKQLHLKFKEKVETESVIIGKMPKDGGACILYVDQLLELQYNCDYRTLISPSFCQFSQRKSLYPHVHEFHISFWTSPKFTMDLFMEVLLNVYGLMLKTLEFMEEYVDTDGRKSICWRIQVQSLDLPLNRLVAHQIYLKLREELANRLKVIVR